MFAGVKGFFKSAIANAVDAYFNRTTLLLHGDGTNGVQNNTFVDSSSNNFTITRNGNATQGTFSPFSQTGWSNYFSGSSPNDLTTPDSTAFEFTGDFTIEAFVYPTALGTYNAIIAHWQPGTAAGCSFVMSVNSSKRLVFAYGIGGTVASDVIGSSTTVELNTWSHVVVSRNSGTIRLFVNGTQDATTRTGATGTLSNSPNAIYIGSNTGADYFTGYISNLRVLGGTGVTSVTVPTAPLTDIANTILLTCQSNRFIDTNTQVAAKTITVNGSGVSVQAFSPFAPAGAYSAATNGGAGYFDGSGDYLLTASNAAMGVGASDFTIEFWLYPTSFAATQNPLWSALNGAKADVFTFEITTAGVLNAYVTQSGGAAWSIISAGNMGTLRLNAWNHVALTRSGSSWRGFVNGVQGLTVTSSATVASFNGFIVSGYISGGFYTGYISGLREVVGTAVYTGAFTPPTAPPSAITNTQLLLNFTNGGIIDQTGKNVLETVGNAQISTSVKKYGTGSLAFNGVTGTYLSLIDPAYKLSVGSGDWTYEAWLYVNALPSSSSAPVGLYHLKNDTGLSTTVFVIEVNNTGALNFSTGAAALGNGTSGKITTGSWIHVAVVRQSGVFKTYINGVNDISYSSSTTFNGSNVMIGAWRYGTWDFTLNGYLDDVRITKYARYVTGTGANAGLMVFNGTNTLALPTAAFPDQ